MLISIKKFRIQYQKAYKWFNLNKNKQIRRKHYDHDRTRNISDIVNIVLYTLFPLQAFSCRYELANEPL